MHTNFLLFPSGSNTSQLAAIGSFIRKIYKSSKNIVNMVEILQLQVDLKDQNSERIRFLIDKYNEMGLYYTSYPTLGIWSTESTQEEYVSALQKIGHETVALYLHFPYCKKLCWYCICNALISSDHKTIQHFFDYLCKEIDMLRDFFKVNSIHPNIREIHLGGGTPSHMTNIQFDQLMNKLQTVLTN